MMIVGWIFLIGTSLAALQSPEADAPRREVPPEERRLSPAIFREGLKKRGLMELLDLHLKEYPPASPSAAALMAREVKIAQFNDPLLPLEQRRAAIREANDLLEKLIADNADDVRAIEWRFVLAHSLLYQEGDSFATNLLYFGGTKQDRESIAPLTARALATLRELIVRIDAENRRVDALSPGEFERLESSGFVEKLDGWKPSAEFLLLWALFYDSIHRPDKDPVREQQLEEIIKIFIESPDWFAIPQDKSHVQVQSLLLAGMSERRLRDYTSARQYLERTEAAAGRISDDNERKSVDWALLLGGLEAGRNARDEQRYDDALSQVTRLRAMPTATAPGQYGIRLSAALLERSIQFAHANAAEKAGRTTDARNFREEAWRVLAKLAAEEPQNKSVLYSELYRSMESVEEGSGPRDPIEMCAMLAGTLEEAARDESRKEELLRKAIAEGEKYLAAASGAQRSMTPEILFQMGTAYYRLGDLPAAAEKMLEIARKYTNYGQAGNAAVLAVQLGAQVCLNGQCPPKSANQEQYRQALETLLSGYPNLEAAEYWRFFYAQLLEDMGDYSGAAEQYGRIPRGQEHYLESAFRRVRSLARLVAEISSRQPASSADSLAGVNLVNTAYRDLLTRATSMTGDESQPQSSDPQDFVAQGRLWLADAYVLKSVNRPEQALELLLDFESSFGPQSVHLGRVWQVRLRAYQLLGRLDEAAKAVPAFVAADPRNAGPTLQSLYDSMLSDWRRQQLADGSSPPFDSEVMLLVAEQIEKWTERGDVTVTEAQKREAELQLAQTNMLAGNHAKAIELYKTLLPPGEPDPRIADEFQARAMLGLAEALAGSGDTAKALPEFNRLATRLPPENEIRWEAMLGDLEARTSLQHPPAGILQVIAQQRRLFPDLGGPRFAARFERIERENIRRRDQLPKSNSDEK